MAGRKQHFIPQHFQRPFAIPGSKGSIWVFRRGKSKPFPSPIADTAAQRDFYSKPSTDGIPTLDDLITEYELTLHQRVNEIRKLETGASIPAAEIAELVTHLAIRSSYMRGMVKDAAVSMAEAIQAVTTGEINGQKIQFPMHRVPSAIEDLIIEEFEKRGLGEQTPVEAKTIAKLLYFGLREGADEYLQEAKSMIELLVEELAINSASISFRTQTTVLGDALAPEARVKMLSELNWTVVSGPESGAILPDCTSLAFDGEKWTALILVGNDKIKAVALPLTPERIALGVAPNAPAVDISDFNQFAAQASHTLFLSSSDNPELTQILPNLGGTVRSELSEMTGSAMEEAVQDFLSSTPDQTAKDGEPTAAQISWTTGDEASQFSMPVAFHDFGDEAFAKNVADVLTSIMSSFTKHLPVSGLAGFVFATDYKSALNSIERGFEPSSEISPLEDGDLIGVGMPLAVLEQGEAKTKIVLRSSVAADLISEDEDIRAEAIDIVVHMLASAALSRLMVKKFPDQILKPIDDEYEAMIFSFGSGVFDAYFCASVSCSSKRLLKLYEKLAHESLLAALDRIPILRRAYRSHGDMDRLFPEASDLLRGIMMAMARLLGTMKCQGVELADESELEHLLSENGLRGWYRLFQRDLMSFDDGLETWAQFAELFFVNRHFERLAAQFSLIPEPTEGAGIYVHVPGQADMDMLSADE